MHPLRTTVLALIAVSTVGLGVLAATQHVFTHTEDFTTTDHRDPAATTALWDTGAGEITLAPFGGLQLAGGYDTPGSAYHTAVAGDHVYVADYTSGIQVLDVSDPAAPVLAGTLAMGGQAVAVAVEGDHLYVANYYGSLDVVDISDPTNPILVGQTPLMGNPHAVVVNGDVAYLACYYGGVQSVDVSDPTMPLNLDSFATTGPARDVCVAGDVLFVADGGGGLLILDVSDPAAIAPEGSVATTDDARAVVVTGDRAFVAVASAGVDVFDITLTTSPIVVGNIGTPAAAEDVCLTGDFIYVVCGSQGLVPMDIHNPDSPQPLPRLAGLGGARRVTVAGEHAYVSCGSSGLNVVDICDPTYPRLSGSCPLPDPAECLAVAGDLVYAAGFGTPLEVIDISDPTQPAVVGGNGDLQTITGLVVVGDLLYAADYLEGLLVCDIGLATSPTVVGIGPPTGSSICLAIAGDHAFVGQSGALVVFDISDPVAPVPIASLPANLVRDVCISGNLLLAADYTDGVHLIDISTPGAPVLLNTYSGPGIALGVEIAGDLAYLAMQNGDLQVIDISDPAGGPMLVGQGFVVGGSVYDVAVAGDLVYVAVQNQGVAVFDVSDPTSPVLVGYNDASVDARRIVVDGDHALVAASGDGIRIFSALYRTFDHGHCIAQSLPIDVSDFAIMASRLATTETGRITWQLSNDGGGTWEDVTPDDAWHLFATPGTDLVWRSTLHLPSPQLVPSCSTLDVAWLFDLPIIATIEDVPGDQGRQVRIRWWRSGYDFVGHADQIVEYAIYRRVDAAAKGMRPADLPPGAGRALRDHALQKAVEGWDFVTTVPVRAQDEYSVVVPTLADSTESGTVWSAFVVSAMTATPGVFFDSPADSGYSVDNLAPSVPTGLVLAGAELGWDESPDADFDYFTVYGSSSPELGPGATVVGHTVGTELTVDPAAHPYWHVTATDFAGNESAAASTSSVTGVPDLGPARNVLHASAPNPFNPRTTIRFELARAGRTTLAIHDLTGRRVRTLVAGEQLSAAAHERSWDGRDDAGRPVAAGVYVCRLETDGFRAMQRMTLVK
jgi:hypothetical protein